MSLRKIFLSASIPLPEDSSQFSETVDVTAIRDSVRALTLTILPHAKLVWGGHPAITPLVHLTLQHAGLKGKSRMTIYQSNFFKGAFPQINKDVAKVVEVRKKGGKVSSLKAMRIKMFEENIFSAAVFIGGMQGVIDEFKLLKQMQPEITFLPIASTGAAAKYIFENFEKDADKRLTNDFAYISLFNDILLPALM